VKRICFWFAVSCLALAQPSAGQSTPAAQPANSKDHYAILTEKNIFVRNRPATRANRPPSNGIRRPEEMLVLTGIALQEGRHVAFIENRSTNVTQRLLPGAPVLGGNVVAVGFDSLEFESGGKNIQIRVGRNFLGDVSAAPAPPAGATTLPSGSTTAPASAGTAPASPPLPNDPNLSAEERMKLRRQQMTK
jgi:hypothetical protein